MFNQLDKSLKKIISVLVGIGILVLLFYSFIYILFFVIVVGLIVFAWFKYKMYQFRKKQERGEDPLEDMLKRLRKK